jgi:hypothetical protein
MDFSSKNGQKKQEFLCPKNTALNLWRKRDET